MKLLVIFCPLMNKKSVRVFLVSSIIIALIYALFSIAISLFSQIPFPQGKIIDIVLFAGLKSVSTFSVIEWIILSLFPIIGGLLYSNYSYWKCKSSKTAHSGLVLGLIAGVCPACLLPIVGISSFITFVTTISVYIKVGALLLLLGATYYVANKQNKCK